MNKKYFFRIFMILTIIFGFSGCDENPVDPIDRDAQNNEWNLSVDTQPSGTSVEIRWSTDDEVPSGSRLTVSGSGIQKNFSISGFSGSLRVDGLTPNTLYNCTGRLEYRGKVIGFVEFGFETGSDNGGGNYAIATPTLLRLVSVGIESAVCEYRAEQVHEQNFDLRVTDATGQVLYSIESAQVGVGGTGRFEIGSKIKLTPNTYYSGLKFYVSAPDGRRSADVAIPAFTTLGGGNSNAGRKIYAEQVSGGWIITADQLSFLDGSVDSPTHIVGYNQQSFSGSDPLEPGYVHGGIASVISGTFNAIQVYKKSGNLEVYPDITGMSLIATYSDGTVKNISPEKWPSKLAFPLRSDGVR